MDVGLVLVQFIHILGGAAWLGGSILANLVLLPFLFRQPPDHRRDLIRNVVLGPERLMIGAAVIGGAMGIVRGTVFGPIRSVAALGTGYGMIWLTAILITVGVFAVGGAYTSRAARRLIDDDGLWVGSAKGEVSPEFVATAGRLRAGFRIELLGILVVLALMAGLRFA